MDKMQELKEKFETVLKEITDYADETQQEVDLSLGDPFNVNRSIGGTYYPKGSKQDKDDFDIEWQSSYSQYGEEEDSDNFILNAGVWAAWQSSSEEC